MTLSVILANYNHEKYLPIAIEAILGQSHPATEIVIVDDASNDESVRLIQRYSSRYPAIRLYQNEQNLGPVATYNKAVQQATGQYLIFCAADDCVLPGFFEQMVHFMTRHPEAALCTSISRYFKEDGSFLDASFEELGKEERLIQPNQLVKILRTTSFNIPTHTSIYRRDVVLKHRSLIQELKMVCDFYLNYAIAFSSPIGYIPRPLAAYRQGESSYSSKIFRSRVQREKVFHNLLEKIGQEPKEVQTHFCRSALLSLFGLKMVLFLAKTPKYWSYLVPILRNKSKKMVVNKIRQYTKRRSTLSKS